MRKLSIVLSAALLIIAAAPRPALARGTNLVLQLDPVGLSTGVRLAGPDFRVADSDFFDRNQGGLVGFRFGFNLQGLELMLDMHQFYNDDRAIQFWLAGLLGINEDFRLDSSGRATAFVAVDGGYGFSNTKPINPPIVYTNISEKGIVGLLRLGVDFWFTRWSSIGLEYDTGYHYLWLDTAFPTNRNTDTVQGLQFTGLLNIKLLLGTGNEYVYHRPRTTTYPPTYEEPAYEEPYYQQPPAQQVPPPPACPSMRCPTQPQYEP